MQNYESWTIVPVGTKIVRTQGSSYLKVWEVYIVSYTDDSFIRVEGSNEFFNIDCFAPYIEEEKKEEVNSLPTYVVLKYMPWISKGSVIVQRTDWTVINQADDNFSNNRSNYIIDYLNWLLKEHPEDFKKIN